MSQLGGELLNPSRRLASLGVDQSPVTCFLNSIPLATKKCSPRREGGAEPGPGDGAACRPFFVPPGGRGPGRGERSRRAGAGSPGRDSFRHANPRGLSQVKLPNPAPAPVSFLTRTSFSHLPEPSLRTEALPSACPWRVGQEPSLLLRPTPARLPRAKLTKKDGPRRSHP